MSLPPAANSAAITIHEPGSSASALSEGTFDRRWFMGSWGVAWSTLPMWKGKKDVVITYDNPKDEQCTSFDSSVASRKESAVADSSPSTVKGTETLTKDGPNAATFDWQGKSYLFFVHSHWEVLAHGTEPSGLEYAVTFFSKTLFTPAGLDIYVRKSPSNPLPSADDLTVRSELVDRIAEALGQSSSSIVKELAGKGFKVPGIV